MADHCQHLLHYQGSFAQVLCSIEHQPTINTILSINAWRQNELIDLFHFTKQWF